MTRRARSQALRGDGDWCVTEAELRAAAEARGVELTEEQVQAFMALEADGDCVGLEAFLNSVDGSEEGDIDETLKYLSAAGLLGPL